MAINATANGVVYNGINTIKAGGTEIALSTSGVIGVQTEIVRPVEINENHTAKVTLHNVPSTATIFLNNDVSKNNEICPDGEHVVAWQMQSLFLTLKNGVLDVLFYNRNNNISVGGASHYDDLKSSSYFAVSYSNGTLEISAANTGASNIAYSLSSACDYKATIFDGLTCEPYNSTEDE